LMNSKWNTANFEFDLKQFGETKLSVRKAVPLGTNFLSDVFNVTVIVNNNQSYEAFVKVLPSEASRAAACFTASYYEREAVMYQEWLPQMSTIRLNKGLNNTDIPLNVANAYYLNLVISKEGNSYENDTVYVLENFKSRGFQMIFAASTVEGLDLNHARLAARTYANYHALSIANYRQHKKTDGTLELSEPCQVFLKSIYYIHPVGVYRSLVIPHYSNVLRHFHHPEAAEWLNALDLETVFDLKMKLNAGTLSCVLHGDAWTNNILYRYENDKSEQPIEIAMVDWQYAAVGHPMMDVLFYLLSATSSQTRQQYLDQLLLDYFTTLKLALRKLDIDLDSEGYSFDQFKIETKQYAIWAMCTIFFMLPIILDPAKATGHALKDKKQPDNSQERILEENLDEEGTKKEWASLFEADSVIKNSLLSERLVGLILDVKKMTTN